MRLSELPYCFDSDKYQDKDVSSATTAAKLKDIGIIKGNFLVDRDTLYEYFNLLQKTFNRGFYYHQAIYKLLPYIEMNNESYFFINKKEALPWLRFLKKIKKAE